MKLRFQRLKNHSLRNTVNGVSASHFFNKSDKGQVSFSPVLVTFPKAVTKYFDKSNLKNDGVLLAHSWRYSSSGREGKVAGAGSSCSHCV